MNIADEGYIKYNINHQFADIEIPENLFSDLSYFRTLLHGLELVGETKEGIGYGNISQKLKNGFVITGSATGAMKNLDISGYAFVSSYSIKENLITSTGRTKASSESLSHAAIYGSCQQIESVVHVHHKKLWGKYLNVLPTSSGKVTYGTPEMANEMKKVLRLTDCKIPGIVIMGGHENGIVSFGKNISEAAQIIIDLYNML